MNEQTLNTRLAISDVAIKVMAARICVLSPKTSKSLRPFTFVDDMLEEIERALLSITEGLDEELNPTPPECKKYIPPELRSESKDND